MIRALLLGCIFLVGAACDRVPTAAPFKLKLVKSGFRTFRIDSTTSIKSWYVDIFENDSGRWLLYQNRNLPSLQFYDLEHQTLGLEVPLLQTGPGGVGTINGFYVKSLDSIYLLNVSDMRLFLVNKKGIVQKYFSFLKPLTAFPFGSMSTPTIISGSPAIFFNGKLHFAARPGTGPTSPETFQSGKVDLAIDLTTGAYNLDFNYPEVYRKAAFGNFWGKIFRAKTHDSRIVYSFAADERIYVTDYTQTESFDAASSIFDRPLPYEEVGSMRLNNIRSTMYGGIFFDKYRKLYYRIVTGGAEVANNRHITQEVYDSKPISVIILNLDFKKVGETRLPNKMHDPLAVCVAKEGLLISNSNLDNPELPEDELSFTVYLPEESKK